MAENVSIEYLRECFSYDELTGVLTWNIRPRAHFANARIHASWNSRYAGTAAGCDDEKGYLQVQVGGCVRRLHRVVWALIDGLCLDDVPADIDHKDLDGKNNRKANLRPATRAQNLANKGAHSNNTSGVKGVCWDKNRGKWVARINVRGRNINLGRFDDKEEASSAYAAAANDHNGEFARVA